MASTGTCENYSSLWEKVECVRGRYSGLLKEASDNGLTLAAYAGSKKLANLIECAEGVLKEAPVAVTKADDIYHLQQATIAILQPLEKAMSDAILLEKDPDANLEYFSSSRPAPLPIIF